MEDPQRVDRKPIFKPFEKSHGRVSKVARCTFFSHRAPVGSLGRCERFQSRAKTVATQKLWPQTFVK